jgi:hypothetical protein
MFTTFVLALIVATIVVFNWRLFVLVAAALILALMVTATYAVTTFVSDREAHAVVAPAQPGLPDLSGEAIAKAEPPAESPG